jgi:hypothetical protein
MYPRLEAIVEIPDLHSAGLDGRVHRILNLDSHDVPDMGALGPFVAEGDVRRKVLDPEDRGLGALGTGGRRFHAALCLAPVELAEVNDFST